MPLEVSGSVVEGALVVECTKLDGEMFKIDGLSIEDSGTELATRIQEQVPTVLGFHWKVVLPSGAILEDDTVLLPLHELLDLDVASAPPITPANEVVDEPLT